MIFYPRPVLAFGYCCCLHLSVCVCLCVNHKFVRTITHQPFKLGSPNLDQRCKRPWLRPLLFCGTIDRDLQGQIELQSQNLPHFELVDAITRHQLKLQFPNLEQKCILALFRSLPILGFIEIDLQLNFYTHHTTKLVEGILVSLRPSVRPSVCPSVHPSRIRFVASTVQDGFFPYLVQMINSMRGCVACDNLWPWPWKSCPLCSVYSSGWSLSIFGTNDH